jgi:L-fuculokinase
MDKALVAIDIGMTNKKIALFDEKLRLLDSDSASFGPRIVEGIECHDLEAIEEWLFGRIAHYARSNEIGAISVSTHGATVVFTDDEGEACAPCVYYTHDPGPGFDERFYALVGDRQALQRETGTADLGALINPAKTILFTKERFPQSFSKTRCILNYPQYWAYRLTGVAVAEATATGAHTYLWNWIAAGYSEVAGRLDILDRLPGGPRTSWEAIGAVSAPVAERLGLGSGVLVTAGIHDSNSSLLPHLVKGAFADFVLNSTGSWLVAMHPMETYGFSDDEIGKTVFYNRSAFGKPVKTALFPGGLEYEAWNRLIEDQAGRPVRPVVSDYEEVVTHKAGYVLPGIVGGLGQFPESRGGILEGHQFHSFAEIQARRASPSMLCRPELAKAALNLSLAIQTVTSLRRIGLGPATAICTEGGFRKNDDYLSLVAQALPDNVFMTTDLAEASLIGSAICALAALVRTSAASLAPLLPIKYTRVLPGWKLTGLDTYTSDFIEVAS